jgi:leader peptidase (prepilin peptidase)/N-methyltransferase
LRCPACGEPIGPNDNVSLLSYALLCGRCRNCKARILALYPLIEALSGLLFAAAA